MLFRSSAAAIYFRCRAVAVITVVFSLCLGIEAVLPVPKETGVIIGGLWLVVFIPTLALFYFKRKNFCLLSLLLSGLCTQAVMVASPAIPLRLHTMFEFVLHILLAECIVYLYRAVTGRMYRLFVQGGKRKPKKVCRTGSQYNHFNSLFYM